MHARELEGRLYPDELVRRLPHVPPDHPLAGEWLQRRDSAARLLRYLRRLPAPPVAVEVGCGNGWLSNVISRVEGSEVVGLDANEVELEQARRVFGPRPNVRFVLGDATVAPSPVEDPTLIVLASAIQYVGDLRALLDRLLGWLAPGGELHILDSPLYEPADVPAARARTRRYYERLGVPEMATVYRHHVWSELDGFEPELLYRPDAVRPRLERALLRKARSPFPWIRVRARPRR